MKQKLSKNNLFVTIVISTIMVFTFVTNCVPPSQKSAEEELVARKARRDSLRKVNYHKCEFTMSNANQYKLQGQWQNSIDNYRKIIEYGCTEDFAQNLFKDMAHCYNKLGKNDSAIWAVKEALVYRSTDIYFLKLLAYYHEREGDLNAVVKDWERINTLFPDNIEYMFKLADYYFKVGKYTDEINLLEKILLTDPGNKKADLAIISAYEASGIDPIERYKTVYMKDKSNAQNGYRYGKALFDAANYDQAIKVLSESKNNNPNNRSVIELLCKSYDYKGMTEKSLEVYKELARKYSNDSKILIKVTELNLNLSNFKKALEYIDKAIKLPDNKGDAYKLRGDVYYAIAEDCFSQKNKMSFSDKLVFHMAYEDYKNALANGNRMVKSKLQHLKKNEMIISNKSDYFLAPKTSKISSNEFKPLGDCYSWIKRTVKVK